MTVMITNGNNVHDPEYHAEVTARKIVVIGESASDEKKIAGRALIKAVERILIGHHQSVHDTEQAHLSTKGAARYDAELDAAEHFDADNSLLVEIVAATKGTVLESHYARQEVQQAVLSELHHETRSQMQVHRLVHERAAELSRAS